MRATSSTAALLLLALALALPAWTTGLVDAPPPPPMPEGPHEEYAGPLADKALRTGQVLYEANCTACHESVMRIGGRTSIRSLPELGIEVERRAQDAGLRWSPAEIAAVVRHLDLMHYRFTP